MRQLKALFVTVLGVGLLQRCTIPRTNSGEETNFCANSIYFVEIIENGDIGGLEPGQCKKPMEFSDGNSYKYENSVAAAEAEAAADPASQGKNVVWGPRANGIPWCRGEEPARYWIYEDESLDGCD